MKNLFTLVIALILVSFSLNAQVPGFFELTVTDMPGAQTNRVVVQMKPINSVVPQVSTCDGDDNIVTDIVAGFTFGIKWPVSSGITQVAINSSGNSQPACPDIEDPSLGYGIANGGGNILTDDGTYRVRPFLILTTPTAVPQAWVPNEWITICTLSITGGNCTVCEALDIYELGDFPEVEAQVDVSPVWAFDLDGSSLEVYEATPNNGPLPLDLISFEAEKFQTQDAKLTWATANEENTSHFSVQRSLDKKTWTEINTVPAAGYSIEVRNYSIMDAKVYNGRDARMPVYYRLNMVDMDGKQRFSPIESVVFGNNLANVNEFTLYPNPASDGVQFEWNTQAADQPTSLEFYDIAGKLIYTHRVGINATAEYVDFSQNQINAGVYMVRIMNGTTPLDHQQLVVGKN